jgi:hypothetical protein
VAAARLRCFLAGGSDITRGQEGGREGGREEDRRGGNSDYRINLLEHHASHDDMMMTSEVERFKN